MKFFGFGKSASSYPRPEDLSFIPQDDYDLLIKLITRALKKNGYEFAFDVEGVFKVRKPKVGFGISNLAKLCALSPKSEWGEIIEDFVAKIKSPLNDSRTLPLGDVRSKLKLRLGPRDLLDAHEPSQILVLYDESEAFLTYLALDFPDKVETVHPEALRNWELSREDAFDIALENVWVQDQGEKRNLEHDAFMLGGESFFTASHILLLDRHMTLPLAGALCIVPNRHLMMCLPILSREAVDTFLARFIVMAAQGYKEGPGSISPEVLWHSGDRIVPLDLDTKEDAIELKGPDSFLRAIGEL